MRRGSEGVGFLALLPLAIGVGLLIVIAEGLITLAQLVYRYIPAFHLTILSP